MMSRTIQISHFLWRGVQKLEAECLNSETGVAHPYSKHAWMLNCLSCLNLCDPMDHSPPASSAHARILELVAISFSLFKNTFTENFLLTTIWAMTCSHIHGRGEQCEFCVISKLWSTRWQPCLLALTYF